MIEPGCISDYEALAQFHYRGSRPQAIKAIYRAMRRDELCGVIVYVSSITHPLLRGRHIAFPRLLEIYRSRGLKALLQVLKRNALRIARVIVYPKYRGIGLGARLVRETMPLTEYPIIEALAVMARFNPFFEHAGLTRINYETSLDEQNRKLIKKIQEVFPDIEVTLIHEPAYLYRYINNLRGKKLRKLASIINSIIKHAPTMLRKRKRKIRTRREIIKTILSTRISPIYYVWCNPELKPDWNLAMT